jgi:hypothetical protein
VRWNNKKENKKMEIVEVLPNLYLSNLESMRFYLQYHFSYDVTTKKVSEGTASLKESDMLPSMKLCFDCIISIGCDLSTSAKSDFKSTSDAYIFPLLYSFPQYEDNPSGYLLDLCHFQLNDIISSYLVRKQKVIVHCVYGQSRSVTAIITYMIKYHHYSLMEAFNRVKEVKSSICVNPGFLTQLSFYDLYCHYEYYYENYERVHSEGINAGKEEESSAARYDTSDCCHRRLRSDQHNDLLLSKDEVLHRFDQLRLVFRLLQASYHDYCLPTSVFSSSSVSDSFIACNSCRTPLISTEQLFDIDHHFFKDSDKIGEDCLDSFWGSYSLPFSSAQHSFFDQFSESVDSSSEKKKKRKLCHVQDLFSLFELIVKKYHVLPCLPETLYSSSSKKDNDTCIVCKKCGFQVGKYFPKCYPLIGKYCFVDLYILLKEKCRIMYT